MAVINSYLGFKEWLDTLWGKKNKVLSLEKLTKLDKTRKCHTGINQIITLVIYNYQIIFIDIFQIVELQYFYWKI